MRSARWKSAGRKMCWAKGFLPSADWAPAEWARRSVSISRGSRLKASAPSFSLAATPTRLSSVRPGVAASWPMVVMPSAASFALVTGPTPHISSTGRSWSHSSSIAGSTTTRPSGLATCEAILARCLVRATPTEIGRPTSSRTRRRTICGDRLGRAEEMLGAGDVGKGLVDRDAFDQRGVVVEDLDRGVAEPLVLGEVAAGEDEVRAEFLGLPAAHAAADAEGLGFVGTGEHHTAADRDRLAAQARIEHLLDRGVEGVEIGVKDGGAVTWSTGQARVSSDYAPGTNGEQDEFAMTRGAPALPRTFLGDCRSPELYGPTAEDCERG